MISLRVPLEILISILELAVNSQPTFIFKVLRASPWLSNHRVITRMKERFLTLEISPRFDAELGLKPPWGDVSFVINGEGSLRNI